MKGILIKVGGEASLIEYDENQIEGPTSLQHFVDGWIELVPASSWTFGDLQIVVDEEGRMKGKLFNIYLGMFSDIPLVGDGVIVGAGFTELPDFVIERFKEKGLLTDDD